MLYTQRARRSTGNLRFPVTDAKPCQYFFNSLEKAMLLKAHQVD